MIPKSVYALTLVIHRLSYVLWALSLIYLAISIQGFRFGDRNRVGVFPLSALFCLTFAVETFVRSGVLFAENTGVAQVFDLLKPYFDNHGKDLQFGDATLFAWKMLGREDGGLGLVLRAVSIAFTIFLLVNRLSVGSGAAPPQKTRWYQIRTFLLIVAFAALCGMSAASCTVVFDQRRIKLEPTVQSVVLVSENLQVCIPGPLALGDALVTIALLHASFSWTKSSWIGIQHVLAFRWAATVVHMMNLHLQNKLLDELIQNKPSMTAKFEAISVLLQVGAVFLLFVPRFAARQPLSTLFIMAILGGSAAVVLGRVPVSNEMAFVAHPLLGQLFVLFCTIAVLLTGGIGISFFMFAIVGAAQINAPWVRNIPAFNLS